tara:strand:+ start:48 stop:440 length:393 start_codon:yes stop_codon:yes gene_type:complete
MNYIQIKQVGNLQSNLNTLSDSIYQTGQYLLGQNEGGQTFDGEKTFEDEVYFNTGVRIYGTVTGQSAIFNEDVEVKSSLTVNNNPVPYIVAPPSTVSSIGLAGQLAYTSDHLYICTGTNAWARADISGWA